MVSIIKVSMFSIFHILQASWLPVPWIFSTCIHCVPSSTAQQSVLVFIFTMEILRASPGLHFA